MGESGVQQETPASSRWAGWLEVTSNFRRRKQAQRGSLRSQDKYGGGPDPALCLLHQKREPLQSPCGLSTVQEIPSSRAVLDVLGQSPGLLRPLGHSGPVREATPPDPLWGA